MLRRHHGILWSSTKPIGCATFTNRRTSLLICRLKTALTDRRKLLLTATPLQNSLLELFGLVSIIDQHAFGDIKSFREQFPIDPRTSLPNTQNSSETVVSSDIAKASHFLHSVHEAAAACRRVHPRGSGRSSDRLLESSSSTSRHSIDQLILLVRATWLVLLLTLTDRAGALGKRLKWP